MDVGSCSDRASPLPAGRTLQLTDFTANKYGNSLFLVLKVTHHRQTMSVDIQFFKVPLVESARAAEVLCTFLSTTVVER